MLNKALPVEKRGESMDIDVISKALANPLRRQILQWLKEPEQFLPVHNVVAVLNEAYVQVILNV